MDNNTPGSRKLFLKPAKSGFIQSTKSSENGNSGSLFNVGNNPFLKKIEDEDAPKNEQDPSEKSNLSSDLKDDLFKPAKKNLNLFTNASTLSDNSFVFGQNLHERVVIDKTNSASESTTSNNKDDELKSNSSLLFSSALSSNTSSEAVNSDTVENNKDGKTQPTATVDKKDDDKEKDESSSNDKNSISLVEAARRYEEMKGAQKRKYEEVEVKTGEEDEKNILEMNCKLFTFDKNNWEERGRGMLRLNDSKNSSRVVFRASGSFRVLLNTKVWKDQLCEQPSCKSLRLTAFDTNGLLKIYLVMGKNEDIENLYHFLSTRIQREKDKTPEPDEESNSSTTQDTVEDDSDLKELPTKKFASSDE